MRTLFPVSEESPQERLWRRGSRCLSDAELLGVLLGGSPAMAQQVLDGGGGLGGLLHCEAPMLLSQRGIGVAKACIVLALVELTRRMARLRLPPRQLLKRPDLVAGYLYLRYHQLDQEVVGALYVDVRQRLIEERELYRGTISRTAVEPRAFLKPAFLYGAAGMIVFHTHPSGDPAPSAEDLCFSRRLKAAAEICGVTLHEHLILGSHHRFVSLDARGSLI